MPQRSMQPIKNIVFLMLENRSLDNLLGWLYAGSRPSTVFPENSSPLFDGLLPDKFRLPYSSTVSYPVIPIPDKYMRERVPAWDPYEEMYTELSWNGVLNQLFGDQNLISDMPSYGTQPTMKGFYQDYYSRAQGEWEGLDITWTYQGSAPIINLLAKAYAVSDAWFCSVPTQTNPNRAYSLIGTSQGRENNLHYSAVETYIGDTIFNALGKAGKSWGLYYKDPWHSPKSGAPKQCFTQYTFPNLSSAPNGEIGLHDQFFQRVADGTLPTSPTSSRNGDTAPASTGCKATTTIRRHSSHQAKPSCTGCSSRWRRASSGTTSCSS